MIFSKYQSYLDRLEKDTAVKNENKIVIEEKKHSEKILGGFPYLRQPWKPITTPAFIFLTLLFFLHLIFFPKTTLYRDWSFFTGMIHNVNLVFHEAGHLLFGIFGNDTLMTIGGSLNQLLIPFVVFASFFYNRDRAGTGFALIWFFGNFIDVSIYMADGRFLKLPLIGGLDMEAHDWRNLFNHFDLWSVDQTLSKIIFYLGWVGIFLTWVWLYKNWRSNPK
ncbi:MAG: hypothetical protein HN472_14820 [Nitrospina sp.]|nr:hypothetical protein [Nitrospina sp.]MBT3876235.1 hypothetical protein [Nitrospina sp.]MBT4048764.1 hypothetical protein [Nitrospina sp.]MBT4556564.1 hypothetical protein [Nitrospina sp.]MBT5347428.1 hypothetical protein [Nitrospina sp.]